MRWPEPQVWAALIAAGLATYLVRLAGFYVLKGFAPRGRTKAALDALPPAVLMAVIAPTVLATGPAETGAALATAVAAALRLPMVVVILTGVISVVLLRMMLA